VSLPSRLDVSGDAKAIYNPEVFKTLTKEDAKHFQHSLAHIQFTSNELKSLSTVESLDYHQSVSDIWYAFTPSPIFFSGSSVVISPAPLHFLDAGMLSS